MLFSFCVGHATGAVLVTNNTRDVERVLGLTLGDWVNLPLTKCLIMTVCFVPKADIDGLISDLIHL